MLEMIDRRHIGCNLNRPLHIDIKFLVVWTRKLRRPANSTTSLV